MDIYFIYTLYYFNKITSRLMYFRRETIIDKKKLF